MEKNKMINYKSLKSSNSISLAKDSDTNKITLTKKCFDINTGKAIDDIVTEIQLKSIENDIANYKNQVTKLEEKIADWEELEKDIKAL
tara:strand:- start:1696 stop:1959 length:264 start_codon:yes stop_codon:yes gene_type:complete